MRLSARLLPAGLPVDLPAVSDLQSDDDQRILRDAVENAISPCEHPKDIFESRNVGAERNRLGPMYLY